ncbi:hypothetical protein JOB18_033206 [Solea senegalensis]|uniref:Uncharacterized protein n=1 Tax=Solea senegalensis TaxID=28829 RepID=A0AAV6S6T9_SOLSE|nr:hypothetical protein JOB18_033206 [Solea senegalensis]
MDGPGDPESTSPLLFACFRFLKAAKLRLTPSLLDMSKINIKLAAFLKEFWRGGCRREQREPELEKASET